MLPLPDYAAEARKPVTEFSLRCSLQSSQKKEKHYSIRQVSHPFPQPAKEYTMKPLRTISLTLSLIITLPILLSSCNSALHNVGKTALQPQQIAIKDTPAEGAVWQTDDLIMHYRMKDNGDSLTLAGSVAIQDSVTYSYPIAKFLNLYVYLLNPAGVAAGQHTVRINISPYNTVSDQNTFKVTLPKTENSTAIAFGYWGTFREKGTGGFRERSEEVEVFFNPFTKKE